MPVAQLNLYADQQRAAQGENRPWTPIIKEEFLAFLGMNIAMGVISLHSIDDYWSIDAIISHPWFRCVLSRNRFRQILRFLHIVDNSVAPQRSDPNYDKLHHSDQILTMTSCTTAIRS